MNQQLIEIDGKIQAKLNEQKSVLGKLTSSETPKSDIPGLNDQYNALETEVAELTKTEATLQKSAKVDSDLKARGQAANLPDVTQPSEGRGMKSFGRLIIESEDYKSAKGTFGDATKKRNISLGDYDYIKRMNMRLGMKADVFVTAATDAGIPPQVQQTDLYVPSAQLMPTILPFLPMFPATAMQYNYRSETNFDNQVGTRNEGAALAQSDFKAELVTGTIRVIGHYLKVSIEELEDVPRMEMYMNTRGQLMMDQGFESQLLTGNGTAPNLRGFNNIVGIGSYVRGTNQDTNGNTETNIDSLWRGIVDCRVTGRANPGLIVLHDTNLTPIVLMKNSIGDYIYGDPSNTRLTTLWGLALQGTTGQTQDTALLGDFTNYCAVAMRQGLDISIDAVDDDAIKLQRTIIMYLRANLEVYRATAFEKVSNLTH